MMSGGDRLSLNANLSLEEPIMGMESCGRRFIVALALLVTAFISSELKAQSFGLELFNNVMPASGGMAGASVAAPQDVQSALHGNPATMTQFSGTHFSFSGAWIEPTYSVSQSDPAGLAGFGVGQFDDTKSDAQGVAAGNIAITQDLTASGIPATVGLGLISGAGAGVDLRQIPESNGTHTNIVALDILVGAGVDLTDRLSFGSTILLSNATLDGPFVGIVGSASDYALRGTAGLNFQATENTKIGAYWKTKVKYTFANAFENPVGPPNRFIDLSLDRPEIVGVGLSNSSLLDGKLLLAVDATYQMYTDTALLGAFYVDQWAVQVGAQYAATDRCRFRLGYAWNENPMRDIVPPTVGGIPLPGAALHVQYVQAMFAAIPQHRITAGVGIKDIVPGIDFDLMAGGMFDETQTFGTTTAEVKGYWIGFGSTWRFGRGACEKHGWTY